MSVKVEKIIIPTYLEPKKEDLPMFAEHRVHQRTSGNPYPQKIVLEVNREEKVDKEYTAVILENDYLRLCILPELGGRIYSAYDKRTGYDFFYKNNVIKPALIGCLGSWISGGCEFNWPFHHRASTFMPCDYVVKEDADGTAYVYLSEHDPIDRMKGMVCVILKKDAAYFETRARLYNRTDTAKPFLWWENTAVPVNKDYQIFFPPDVSYVNFHYKRSVTTFPIADNSLGVFNGIRYEEPTDISMHKSTIQPTSYFSAPSKYDFFGGYDHGKKCGVIHIADHHISPGKKMFTWAYNQLSQSWENALTDEDGAYAELMAGVYSDNQPDFAWLEPSETKEFSQFWYPISELGVPQFANLSGAVHSDSEGLRLQFTAPLQDATVVFTKNGEKVYEETVSVECGEVLKIDGILPEADDNITVIANGKAVINFTFFNKNEYDIPPLTEDLPLADEAESAEELYLEGLHVKQYRDPSRKPDYFWKKALERQPNHIDSLLGLGELCFEELKPEQAKAYLKKAEAALTKFNKRTKSGRLYYLQALVELQLGNKDAAYDLFYKSSWNMDYLSVSMTYIGAMDIAKGNLELAISHLDTAIDYNGRNTKAAAFKAIALYKLGKMDEASALIDQRLSVDPLEHFIRLVALIMGKIDADEFLKPMLSDVNETIIDIVCDLDVAGLYDEIKLVFGILPEKSVSANYILGNFADAEKGKLGDAFPSRMLELNALKTATEKGCKMANYYLGCLLYAKRNYEAAADYFLSATELMPEFYAAYRNLSVAYYSHLDRKFDALKLLEKALKLNPDDEQLVYELSIISTDPQYTVNTILNNKHTRDDVITELARAYNQLGEYDKALDTLLSHTFVACEGGEHAIADQYMFAHHAKGRELMAKGDYKAAEQEFRSALVLPQSLGAGIWNEVKYVPHQYYLAVCLENLGNLEGAEELFSHILKLRKDYFTEMHLKALPYYQALCLEHFGKHLEARTVIDLSLKEWNKAMYVEDAGFFATTPFFISFSENAAEERKACYNSLIGFGELFRGNREEALKRFALGNDMFGRLEIE